MEGPPRLRPLVLGPQTSVDVRYGVRCATAAIGGSGLTDFASKAGHEAIAWSARGSRPAHPLQAHNFRWCSVSDASAHRFRGARRRFSSSTFSPPLPPASYTRPCAQPQDQPRALATFDPLRVTASAGTHVCRLSAARDCWPGLESARAGRRIVARVVSKNANAYELTCPSLSNEPGPQEGRLHAFKNGINGSHYC